MRTYEITFTDNKESGIYSANLIKAESPEQAIAYFNTLGKHEIVGCIESNSSPNQGSLYTLSRMIGTPRKKVPAQLKK